MTTRTTNTKRTLLVGAMALAMALGACASDKNPYDPEKPLDKMSKEEWCDFYAHYLTNPNISAATRASATKQMRDRNCPNHA